MLFHIIKEKFPNEKIVNLKKRMYDVINAFCSLGILKKQRTEF